jgi:hypothetical protein
MRLAHPRHRTEILFCSFLFPFLLIVGTEPGRRSITVLSHYSIRLAGGLNIGAAFSALAFHTDRRAAYFSAISRPSKPNDGHSIASDLATNASGAVHADAVGGPGDAAVALADGCTAGVPRGAMPSTSRHLKTLEGRGIHHRPDRP